MLIMLLASCSGLPLGMLGGGTNVAANTQIGRENRQTAVSMEPSVLTLLAEMLITERSGELGLLRALTVNNQDIPPWVLLVALIGWLLPTPTQMGNAIGQVSDGTI
jgi:hypothetical protein